jgi:hypothetical protein
MNEIKYFRRSVADMATEHGFTSFELCQSTKPGQEGSQFIVTDNGQMFRAAKADKLSLPLEISDLEFLATDKDPGDWCLVKKAVPSNVVAKFSL